MANLAQVVELIRADTLQRGESFPSPCSNDAVADLHRRCIAELGLALPADYGSFLLLTNGINYTARRFSAPRIKKGIAGCCAGSSKRIWGIGWMVCQSRCDKPT